MNEKLVKTEVLFMDAIIRPSVDLRNHYNEISKQCRESLMPSVHPLWRGRREYKNLI